MEYPEITIMLQGETFESIFEVGCAEAHLMDYLEGKRRGGIDRRLDTIRGRENFIEADLTNLPWPVKDKEYDIAFTFGTLMYIKDPIPVIKEMFRIADRVIIVEPMEGEKIVDHHGERFYHNYLYVISQALGGMINRDIEYINLPGKVIHKC